MSFDIEKFIDGLHSYLERAFKPLADRLANIERRLDGVEAQAASQKEMDEVLGE